MRFCTTSAALPAWASQSPMFEMVAMGAGRPQAAASLIRLCTTWSSPPTTSLTLLCTASLEVGLPCKQSRLPLRSRVLGMLPGAAQRKTAASAPAPWT